jgi:hypothetical protein
MDATTPVSHSARANLYQNEAHWRLGPDALERLGGEPAAAPWWAKLIRFYLLLLVPWGMDRIDKGGPARFPYAAIQELRLTYEPTRMDDNRHRCWLKLKSGEKASFFSTHFSGVADFEDRGATYVPLVRGLVARVAAANPACRFWAGKSRFSYWAWNVFLLAMVVALAYVIGALAGFELSDIAWAKLAILVGFIPLLALYTRKNYPRRFTPPDIPPQVLPGG